jgi:hypothetical protein
VYQPLHSVNASELFKQQLPPFLIAFVMVELFFKFKSFALECAAFLVTWYVLDAILHAVFPSRPAPNDPRQPST